MTRYNEDGHVTVLAIGLTLVVFAVAGLAVDGTRAFIVRRSLQNLADGIAVSSAGQLNADMYYRSGGASVVVDPERAENAASQIMRGRGLRATVRFSADEQGVEVSLVSETRTSWLRLVGIESIPVSATARAEPFPQRPVPRR